MPILNQFICSPAVLLALLAGPAFAASETFHLRTRVERPPETGEITCCDVTSPLGEFTFVRPAGWRVEVDQTAQRISLHAPDYTAHLQVGFAKENPALAPPASTNALCEQLQAKFPGASILEQFTCHTASGSGLGFDLIWKPAKDFRASTRFAFVPCPAGTLEFCLTTSPENFSARQPVFGAFLTSFSKSSDPDARPLVGQRAASSPSGGAK